MDEEFLCGDLLYMMMENQASVSPNVPYRLLEYITAGLRSTVDSEHERYTMPVNVSTVAGYIELLMERDIFVDLFSDKEVCDMTMAQFSRDDILIHQGREEGREEGIEQGIEAFILDKLEDGVKEEIVIDKLRRRFSLDEGSARRYYGIYAK